MTTNSASQLEYSGKIQLGTNLLAKGERARGLKVFREATKNDPEAFIALSKCYATGNGVKADIRRAKKLEDMALRLGRKQKDCALRSARLCSEFYHSGEASIMRHGGVRAVFVKRGMELRAMSIESMRNVEEEERCRKVIIKRTLKAGAREAEERVAQTLETASARILRRIGIGNGTSSNSYERLLKAI